MSQKGYHNEFILLLEGIIQMCTVRNSMDMSLELKDNTQTYYRIVIQRFQCAASLASESFKNSLIKFSSSGEEALIGGKAVKGSGALDFLLLV